MWTDRHSEELRRGISIKLGYADCEIRKCPLGEPPEAYTTQKMCPNHNDETTFIHRISFVDSPGHETLMATMLSGAALMDGAILVIAANEKCPQPQTREHLAALEVIGVNKIIIVQNKIELVSKAKAIDNYNQINEFVVDTIAENSPIIPISAQHGSNIDVLIQAIEEYIPVPERDLSKPYRMSIARSFDVNKPGQKPKKLVGGVIGGSITQGKINIGDEIELKPGILLKKENINELQTLISEVVSLNAGGSKLKEAIPGGLIGIETKLDPSLTKADGLVGLVAGKPDTLPPVWNSISLEIHLLERVVGHVDRMEVTAIKTGEPLLLNAGTTATVGPVSSIKKNSAEVDLKRTVCAEVGSRISISRRIAGRWRLIGYGILES